MSTTEYRWRHYITAAIVPVLFISALYVLHGELKNIHYHDVIKALASIPPRYVVAAILLTMFNFIVLTGYDTLAFRYIGQQLPYRRIAFTSFIGYAFSNTLGMAMLAGSSVRYRLYSSWGITAAQVAQTVLFTTLTLWLGLFGIAGITFVTNPLPLPSWIHLPFLTTLVPGILFVGIVLCYLILTHVRKEPLQIFGWSFQLPPSSLAVSQVFLASLDWALAGSVLYALLPYKVPVTFPAFLAVFMLAQVAGLISQVPGGLGVFETTLLILFPEESAKAGVIGSLVVFRLIYYIGPLILASILLGAKEALHRKDHLKVVSGFAGRFIPEFAPRFLALATFLAGIVLLVSGATPGLGSRLRWLQGFLSLPVLEISHFLGSLVGAALLLLARGIQRRLDSAYYLTALLLFAGILFSLLKGFDYEEALVLGAMLIALLPCKHYFYRKASLFSEPITITWVIAIGLTVASAIWLGFFTIQHAEFSNQLWWHFSLLGDAPRFQRAMVGVCGLIGVYFVGSILRPKRAEPTPPGPDDLRLVEAIVRNSPRTTAYLALLGDKEILFNQGKNAFLMFGIRNKSWVCMGDPVGSDSEATELIWEFRASCDKVGGRAAFYEVEHRRLHLYLDAGLTLVKMGEEAKVHLPDFSLAGKERKTERNICNKLNREGYTFEIVSRECVPRLFPDLRKISDAWLSEKKTAEKGFSLGCFDEAYLSRLPMAVIRKGGEISCFANVWEGGNKEELSIDLMRYVSGASRDVMDYLFIELMMYGKNEGYRWFNLGMAPFSGLGDLPSRSLWNRLGHFLFRHGENFYNFQGLRDYKEKFKPVWEPRYLAYPGGLTLPAVLTDIASLIAGRIKGVVAK